MRANSQGHVTFASTEQPVNYPKLRGLIWVRWACLSLVFLLCITAIEGHVYAIPTFYSPVGGSVFSIPTILVTGLAFVATMLQRPLRRPVLIELGLWGAVIAIAVAARFAHGAGISIGAGEMGLNTATSFVLLAVGQMSFGRLRNASFALTLMSMWLPFVAIFGFLHWHSDFYGSMSLPTSIMLIALGVACSARFARRALLRPLISGSLVGRATRLLLVLWVGWLLAEALVMQSVPLAVRPLALLSLLMLSATACLGIVLFLGMKSEERSVRRRENDRELVMALHRNPHTGLYGVPMAELYLRGYAAEGAVGLIAIGVDRWAMLRERYGSLACGRALRRVGEGMSKEVDPNELLVQWGEERFVIMTHGLTQEALELRAEELRRMVGKLSANKTEAEMPTLTFSAAAVGLRRGDASLEPSLTRAMVALRQSERAGCNRVVLAAA